MTTSHNQRRAAPAIPSMLAGFLPRRLRAVNVKTWLTLTAVDRRRIADSVVDNVRKALPRIRKEVGNQFLPLPPSGITLSDLDLQVRTYNCLLDLGLNEDLQLVSCLRLNELLANRGFGVRSLVDLLTALEAVGSKNSPQRVENKIKSLIAEPRGLGYKMLKLLGSR